MQVKSWKGYLPQVLAVIAATVCSISDGIQYGWTSPVLPILTSGDSPIKITDTDATWLEMLYMIGGIAGLPVTLLAVDKFGRKKSILIAAVNNLCAWILIACAHRVEMLYVARFMGGMGADVAFVSVPMYIGEFVEKEIRGFLTSFIYIMVLIGVVICYSVAPYVSVLASSSVGAAFLIIQLFTFPWIPETPYYHLLKNNIEEAEKSLKWSRRKDDVKLELAEIKAAVERQSAERGKFIDLFIVKSNRKAITIMTALNAAQHLSSISVILMNLHTILADAEGIIETNSAAIIFSVIMLVSTLCSSTVVDKFGRKVLIISSCLISAVALGGLAVYFTFKHQGYNVLDYNWVPIFSVYLYAAAFRLGIGLVPIIITGEIFPTSIKAYGMTLSDAMYVIFGTLTIYLYHLLESNFGVYLPFYIFSVSCILTAIFTAVYIPETKGKSLEEIQMILKGENKKNGPI